MLEAATLTATDYEIERDKPKPSLNHSIIQLNLGAELRNRYKNKYRILSELSLELAHWPSVPDLCIFPKMPLDLQNDQLAVAEPPLCAIEIISPSQSLSELTTRARDYFRHGVQSCWIVLPPLGNVYVYSAPGEYEIFRANQVLVDPKLDISIPLEDVFD